MLTDTAIKAARPKEKPYKLNDGRGLVLLVNPNGNPLLALPISVREARTDALLSLGIYPDTSLKRARERLSKCRRLVADGVNP